MEENKVKNDSSLDSVKDTKTQSEGKKKTEPTGVSADFF